MILETKIWVLVVLVATGVSLLDLLSWQSKKMYMYILTHLYIYPYIFLYMTICIYTKLNKFIRMSPTVLCYYMDHSSLLSNLNCKFPLQQWETWLLPFAIHLLNFSAAYMYAVSELLSHYSCRKLLYQPEYSADAQVFFFFCL